MYTISLTSDPPDNFRDTFIAELEIELGRHNISCPEVHPFLGDEKKFTLSNFKINQDSILGFQDWVNVNCAINVVLDVLDLDAYVKNDRYPIRSGRRVLKNYRRR